MGKKYVDSAKLIDKSKEETPSCYVVLPEHLEESEDTEGEGTSEEENPESEEETEDTSSVDDAE